ncbi:hypothetical protein K4L44_15440 [Halosquirtibacter laminarini]|uniref:Uncharacterized protein n=1 Tax=Halosquirtibacter laminarini TaxID=3374600 RepID=A0AC61NEB0_9BACT|nr:hypothetical protein K4L44_15440 [Prolixibacteraceae bacterium]
MKTAITLQNNFISPLFQSRQNNSNPQNRLSKWSKVSLYLDSCANTTRAIRLMTVGILLTFTILTFTSLMTTELNNDLILGGLSILIFSMSLLEKKYIDRSERLKKYIYSR